MLHDPEQEARIGLAFESYLKEHHHDEILNLIEENNEDTHRPVIVNAMTLFEANMEVGDYFNAFPNDVLTVFNKVLHRAAIDLLMKAQNKYCIEQLTKEDRIRRTLHARITGLPVCPELTRDTIPRSRDVGHFLSVTATVIRTSVAKVLEYERHYLCNKCGHVFTLEADFEQFYNFVPPSACPNPDGCNSQRFSCLTGESEPGACRDYQEIKIQEQVQRLSVGSIPRSMVVILEDDLVDSCKSGDDVTVFGVICQRWKPFSDGSFCDVELVLKANNLEVNNQQTAASLLIKDYKQEFKDFWQTYKYDPIAGRDHILLSLCPEVFGMYVTKLAIAMVLAGGVQRIDCSETKIRGECHMLLVGDPGTGKSQFLKYAAKIIPRSVLTAGIGSTSAGLTVSAVRDGGDWHLEAGALVLSDGGLCCIDEFNSVKEHDRISIHEAMEQQSISVAKAGIVCKLNTRSTILAATNPQGKGILNESVTIPLASPLLSRFDLVLILLDTKDTNWDHVVSSFILEERGVPSEACSLWSLEKMKAYFSVIKQLKPVVSEDANTILTLYYQLQRQNLCRNAARTTVRMLESLSRLAEAHAKIMYREMVTIEDAIMAVSVMESSMQGGALMGKVNALITTFPADPIKQYKAQCRLLLEGLNLPQLLQKEMERLAKQKTNTSGLAELDSSCPETQTHFRKFKSSLHCITTDGKGDARDEMGLDWFLSINSSPRTKTSPSKTSPQNPIEKPASGSLFLPRKIKHPESKNKNEKHISGIEEEKEVQQSEHKKDLLDCAYVCQRVAKNLREKRLQQLKHQAARQESAVRGYGDNWLSTRNEHKKKNSVSNSGLDFHSDSTVELRNIFGSNYNQVKSTEQSSSLQIQDEKEGHRNQNLNKNLPPVLTKCRLKKRERAENMCQQQKIDGSSSRPQFSCETSLSISSLAERFSFTSTKKSTITTQPENRNLDPVEHPKTNGLDVVLDQTVFVEQQQMKISAGKLSIKRKFSHPDPPTTGYNSKRSFFNRSMVDSADLGNDVLDTDWDLEN